jgi:lipoprotein-anchoring transpeptidase ErfK/SrfK
MLWKNRRSQIIKDDVVSSVAPDGESPVSTEKPKRAPVAAAPPSVAAPAVAGADLPVIAAPATLPAGPSVSKFRQLKDIMWIRETLEDLTAAEFALSVESESQATAAAAVGGGGAGAEGTTVDNPSAATTSSRRRPRSSSTPPPRMRNKKKKRAVDYEKLASQLTKRIEDMTRVPFLLEGPSSSSSGDATSQGGAAVKGSTETAGAVLKEGQGMGRFTYDHDQRAVLLE